MASRKTRYAFAGASGRGNGMYLQPLLRDFAHNSECVGIMDVNQIRMDRVNKFNGTDIPTYKDFDRMMDETDPDCVIVTTVDAFHHEYIIGALERDKNAITEKPMTIDDEKCRAILGAEKKSRGTVKVTFNYRFVPFATRLRQLLSEKIIGDIHSVQFQWYLDTSHGADYYRRWHAEMKNSGGLFVHKATHHFDLVNWWLDDEPDEVFARGELNFYGAANNDFNHVRCHQCPHAKYCDYYFDITAGPGVRQLYFEAESEDGYMRDQCVWGDRIDIFDTMNASVRYKKGTMMAYSLESYNPFEGYRIAFNGERGRIEATEWHATQEALPDYQVIRIYHTRKGIQEVKVPIATGGHGGGDERLRKMLFEGNLPDPWGHLAGSRAGAMSILVGVAANQSVATGRAVKIDDLLQGVI